MNARTLAGPPYGPVLLADAFLSYPDTLPFIDVPSRPTGLGDRGCSSHSLHGISCPMPKIAALLWLVTASALTLLLVSACGGNGADNPFRVRSEVVTAADNPFALAFAPDGRLFYAERIKGNIRVVTQDGRVEPEPFAHLNVSAVIDWGLTGLAIDPDFERNHYVYAYYTEPVKEGPPPIGRPVVIRFTDRDNRGEDPTVIIGDLPETVPNHEGFNANGSIHFGPDGLLYLTVGDYDTTDRPRDLSTAVGKVLRVDKSDGSPAPGNPFLNDPSADPRIFAYGFRRAFNFAFPPGTDSLYGTDHTPVSCEEINIVEAGKDYGWAAVGEFPWSDCQAGSQVPAIHLLSKEGARPQDFLSPVVVTGMEFVSAEDYPTLADSLLVCASLTKQMRRLLLTGSGLNQVSSDDEVIDDCQFDIATSPDGTLYYSNESEIRRLLF